MPNLVIPLVTRLAVTLALCIGFLPSLSRANSFVATDSLANPRSGHTATLLPDGKVLVAGGSNSFGTGELYDPATGTWTDTGTLFRDRSFHTATLLPNGKVLIAGGAGPIAPGGELYDPATGLWTITTTQSNFRLNHTATLLPNGKVLVVGGSNDQTGESIASAELYDSATGTWAHTSWLATARVNHTATLLPNGKVLIVGGNSDGVTVASAELYDPTTGAWTATGSLFTGRRNHTATLLPDNKVLVAGGFSNSTPVSGAEIYDPATGIWTATGSLISTRAYHKATLLPSGKVLVVGGYATLFALSTSAELYDPTTGIWTATGSPATPRYNHTATLLNTGKLLVAGGNGPGYLASAELFDPGLFPDIAVEAPQGTLVSTGGTLAYGFIVTGQTKDLAVTVSNIGNSGLSTIAASLSGPDAGQFSLVSMPPTSLSTGASAGFTLRYSSTSSGAKSATLSIASNDPDENPFTLALTGISFSNTQDTDGDGMNDAAEYMMSALGFDRQVNQSAMVESFYTNAKLYSLSQLHALNADAPLLEKDPSTGKFKLTMGVQKTNNLATSPFVAFPLNTAGTTATINTAGKLEFEFTSPDNAAFFRVESK